MDEHRFDALARTLAAGMPRRRALGATVAGVAASVFGSTPRALAACKKVGRRCDKNKDCCDGAECRGEDCRCKNGRDECAGKCFNFDTDERHCGACDNACAAGEACCAGACVDLDTDATNCGACGVDCPPEEACRFGGCRSCFPQTACDGDCVDLTSDRDHCGACGIECARPFEVCGQGFCRACDLLAGERPCVTRCCAPGRSCIEGECELA
jgi:hypothetical protein